MSETMIQKTADAFVRGLREAFGDDLVSVVLYGSAAGSDFDPKKSDFNFMAVLSPEGIGRLKRARKLVAGWERGRIHFPLFVTEEWIRLSADTFPVEFFDMKQAYRIVEGRDVLAGLELSVRDLRLQCERELKGKLLHLRAGSLLSRGKPREVRTLIAKSIVTYASLFRALLFIQGKPVPRTREDVMIAACGEFHLDLALFRNLLEIRQKGITYTKFELEDFMDRYIAEIDRLCREVDNLITA